MRRAALTAFVPGLHAVPCSHGGLPSVTSYVETLGMIIDVFQQPLERAAAETRGDRHSIDSLAR